MLDKLTEAIQSVLPADIASDVKNNIDAAIKSNFEKMNLVTREQMDIQEKVLQRTRQRVADLEQQLIDLEQKVNGLKG